MVKRKPDLMLILLAIFGLGVVVTLLVPMSLSRSIAEPVSPLQAGVIMGAGLDVFEGEPNINPRLLECENVVLFPHLGSATKETREAMGLRAVKNLQDFFAGKTPTDIVA